jgi:hypothetical protein
MAMSWRKQQEQRRREARLSVVSADFYRNIPAEPPLFFGSGRGRAFGRKPADYYRPAPKLDAPPTSDPPTGTDSHD